MSTTLRQKRSQLGVTQEHMAEKMGISTRQYQRIERAEGTDMRGVGGMVGLVLRLFDIDEREHALARREVEYLKMVEKR